MKKLSLKFFSLALAGVMMLSLSACGKDGKTSSADSGSSAAEQKTISVIAKGETNAFWTSVKSGCMDAGKKYGYKITFRGPSSESAKDLPRQKELLQTALSNKASAILISTIGEGFTDMLKQAYDDKIPVVQFDSGLFDNDIKALDKAGKNPVISTVVTNNRTAAAINAERLFSTVKDDIAKSDKYTVGVIQHDLTMVGIERAEGFKEKFTELIDSDPATKGKCKIITEVKPGESANVYKEALEALYEKGANAIFMTSEASVNQIYNAINAADGKYDKILFTGFDAGTNQINWMSAKKSPKLLGSVAQDSYSIGYKAVEQAVFALENKEVSEHVDIDGAWWDAENLEEMRAKNLVYDG